MANRKYDYFVKIFRSKGKFYANSDVFSVRELCKVLYPYQPSNEDELELKEGDVITVLAKDLADKGWWKGELKGKVGVFPDNFVNLVSSEGNLLFQLFL